MAKAFTLGAWTSPLALALACAMASGPAGAQGVPQRSSTPGGVLRPVASQPAISQPVVQPIPGRDGKALDAALGRLARDPRDIDALIEAGNAALVMGDVEAATGFFRRADQVSPDNPRVKAGLAGAMVHNGDPFTAIPLFDEAEKAGALDSALAADRALAYDLVGDNAMAQKLYRQALTRGPSDEVVRRLALSLAISGDKPQAEQVLSPLLSQRNAAAWRTRAFVLAILGQTEEAVSISGTVLPAELAAGVAPYLRYMPRLTRAQQAAAANFGAFPRASEIGRDDPRVAQFAPKRGTLAAADAALTPKGEPLGRSARDRRSSRNQAKQERTQRVAPPELQPTREATVAVAAATPLRAATPAPVAAAPSRTVSAAVPPSPTPTPAPTPMPAPAPTAVAAAPASQRPASSMLAVAPGFSIAAAVPTQPATPPPAATPAPTPSAPPPVVSPAARPASAVPTPAPIPRSLAEAFAEFDRPNTDATPAAGAVDLRRIKPAKPKPAEPSKPAPPSHPSRIWVQLATGRDKSALGYDWRRMTREKAELFRGKQASISAWGQNSRLLTGPFQTEAAANAFIAQLRRADVDGAFVWTSPAGQVVDALAAAPARR